MSNVVNDNHISIKSCLLIHLERGWCDQSLFESLEGGVYDPSRDDLHILSNSCGLDDVTTLDDSEACGEYSARSRTIS